MVLAIVAASAGAIHLARNGVPTDEQAGWEPAAPAGDDFVGEAEGPAAGVPGAEAVGAPPVVTPSNDAGAGAPPAVGETEEEQFRVLSADPSGSIVYYVDQAHPNASDRNLGTSEDAPLRTVVEAAERVRAGETVLVKEGVYDDGKVVVEASGRPDAPIVIAAYPGHEHRAVLTGRGLETQGSSHLRIRGLAVRDVSGVGIKIRGPVDASAPPAVDIVVENNHTYDTCSSGISVWGVEWGHDPGDYDNIRQVVIRGNLVELANHGCYNEYITVANGVSDIEVAHNTIRIGDASMPEGDEGIDFKNGVTNGRIHHNLIHDLVDTGIYIDGGRMGGSTGRTQRPFVTDIDIYANHIYNVPKAGVAIATEGASDVDGIRVFNNLVHDTGRNGLSVWDHPDGRDGVGSISNVSFVNNTVMRAGLGGSWGGISINHEDATGILIRNNVAWDNVAFDIRGEDETTIDHNLCRHRDICETTDAPLLAGPATGDFSLTADSPAIDAGTLTSAPSMDYTNQPRPLGESTDLGAHEMLPPELPKIVPGVVTAVEPGDDVDYTVVEVPIALSAPASEAVTATWHLLGWTASDLDYEDASGTVEFLPGATHTNVALRIRDDQEVEEQELLLVVVRNPTNAKLGGLWGLGIVFVEDDDRV